MTKFGWLVGRVTTACFIYNISVKLFLINLLAVVVLAAAFAGWQTSRAVRQAARLDFSGAAQAVRLARPVPALLNALTLDQVPDLAWWNAQLAAAEPVLAAADQAVTNWQQSLVGSAVAEAQSNPGPATSAEKTSQVPPADLSAAVQQLRQAQQRYQQTLLVRQLVPQNQANLPLVMAELLTVFLDDHAVIVALQNNQELRATGGFMGSYARLDLDQGKLADLKLQDIYQPAGQVTSPRPAPPGVAEYLSGGQGLRLQDSNWHPDFPSAAPVILELFAAGNETGINTLVAVNLSLIEQLLELVGELYLPDFGITVTSDNLAAVARADRDRFFPGSHQKPHFLSVLANQLKFKLAELPMDQRPALQERLTKALTTKDLQVYSGDTRLQRLAQDFHADGAIIADACSQHWRRLESSQPPPDSDCATAGYHLYLVESNVGVNKANRGVQRQVAIDVSAPAQLVVTILFANSNPNILQPATNSRPAERGDYINYQRLLAPSTARVAAITVDGHPLDSWNETELSTSQAGRLKQIGWLVPVPAGQTATVQVTLEPGQITQSIKQLLITKQPGLTPTPYTITTGGGSQSFSLVQDTAVSLLQ